MGSKAVVFPTDKHDDGSRLREEHQTQTGRVYFKSSLSLEAVLVITETVSCFAEEAFWAALTDSSHSFCLPHSPFLLCCQGAERQLGEVLGIFLLNLYPETQTTRWGTVSCLAQGRTETASVELRKNTLTGMHFWQEESKHTSPTLRHQQSRWAAALLFSSSFSQWLFSSSSSWFTHSCPSSHVCALCDHLTFTIHTWVNLSPTEGHRALSLTLCRDSHGRWATRRSTAEKVSPEWKSSWRIWESWVNYKYIQKRFLIHFPRLGAGSWMELLLDNVALIIKGGVRSDVKVIHGASDVLVLIKQELWIFPAHRKSWHSFRNNGKKQRLLLSKVT